MRHLLVMLVKRRFIALIHKLGCYFMFDLDKKGGVEQ